MQADEITELDAINAVIERLQRVGWRQGTAGGPSGPNCLAGAFRWAELDLLDSLPERWIPASANAFHRLQKHLIESGAGLGPEGLAVAWWNDAPGRTVEDVLLVLKQVRVQLEEEIDAT